MYLNLKKQNGTKITLTKVTNNYTISLKLYQGP